MAMGKFDAMQMLTAVSKPGDHVSMGPRGSRTNPSSE